MAEQIEQYMRTLKLGGMAREWRSVTFQDTEQYAASALSLESLAIRPFWVAPVVRRPDFRQFICRKSIK